MLTRIVDDRVYDFARVVGGRQIMGLYTLGLGSGNDVYCILRMPYSAKVLRLSIGDIQDDEELSNELGSYGEAIGEFIWPAGVAVDSHDNVFVTDEWLNRVTVFSPDGQFLRTFGTSGTGEVQFNRPSGITVDSNDDLYIVDTMNHRVQKCSNEGGFISQWGNYGVHPGEFNSPWGITTDDAGCVFVADHKNHRIQKFMATGEFLLQLGRFGKCDKQFDHPTNVAVDTNGEIYVCDWVNNRVQTYDSDQNYLTTFLGDAQDLSKWQKEYVNSSPDVYKARRRVDSLEPEWRLALPMAVVFDNAKSRLLIADSQRWRIQIYNKLADYSDPQFNI